MKTFEQFLVEAEKSDDSKTKNSGVKHKGKLTDNGYEPFMVTRDGARKNLSILIDAFAKSNEVPYGPKVLDTKATTGPGQKTGGLTRQKLKKKTLYLVGGAVRDHMAGSTPNDYDLATDATMDEIRLILQHAGFSEVAPQTAVEGDDDNVDFDNYKHLPKSSKNKKTFYVQGTDINGEEFVMGVKINGETFEVATFRKDTKGTSDGRSAQMEFTPNIEDDAERRDFTINAMYIPLNQSDGANDDYFDFHGGALDLKKGKVRFVGKPEDRLKEDELRAQRYARFAAQFGDEPDEEILKAIQSIAGLPSLQPHTSSSGKNRDRRGRIYDEFLKALNKFSSGKVDPKKLFKMYHKLGLFDAVFPGLQVDDDDYHDEKDRHLQTAWLLKSNKDPHDVYQKLLDAKWSKGDAKRIAFLLKMSGFNPDVGDEELDQYSKGLTQSGFSTGHIAGKPMGPSSKVHSWGTMMGLDGDAIGAFLKHVSMGDIKASPDDPEFSGLYQIDLRGMPRGTPAIGQKKRQLAYKRFRELLQSQKPKNVM